MNIKTIGAAIFLAAAGIGTTAVAEGWTSTETRGMTMHRLQASPLELVLACDTNHSWGDRASYLTVWVNGAPSEFTGTVSITGSGQRVGLPAEAGTVFQKSVSDKVWTAAIESLRGAGKVNVEIKGKSWVFTNRKPQAIRCK